jgi:hypothetical protein
VGGDRTVNEQDPVMAGRLDAWLEVLEHRGIEIDLEPLLERRIRGYAERLNTRLAAEGDRDPYDLSDDWDLAAVIMLLCEAGLDAEQQPERGPS